MPPKPSNSAGMSSAGAAGGGGGGGSPNVDPEEEQDRWLSSATNAVRQCGFNMKRSLDQNNVTDSLLHASNMLNEMRTSVLSPRNYYSLYMNVFSELSFLKSHLMEEAQRGVSLEPLYEIVQHCGNIVPRLYLLITVGAVCMLAKQASYAEVLRDLTEMCKGVQHPTRGLFLRYYLAQTCKEVLPMIPAAELDVALQFTLNNFVEANRLWVRIKYLMRKQPAKQQEERQQLKLCVGTFLVLTSQLEHLDMDAYAAKVLPNICEQVVACKDALAQGYIMEAVSQVFPDEFHLKTLEMFLVACRKLDRGVDLKVILIGLMNRLAQYAHRSPSSTTYPVSSEAMALVPTQFYEELQFFVSLLDPAARALAVHHVESFQAHDPKSAQKTASEDTATQEIGAEMKEEKLERKIREDEEDDPLKIKEHITQQQLHSKEYEKVIMPPVDVMLCEEALFSLARSWPSFAERRSDEIAFLDSLLEQAFRALGLCKSPLLTSAYGAIPKWESFSVTASRLDTLTFVRSDNVYRKRVLSLMRMPLEKFETFLPVLDFNHWRMLNVFLAKPQRKRFAMEVARRALSLQEPLSNSVHVESFFMLLETLLTDEDSSYKESVEEANEAAKASDASNANGNGRNTPPNETANNQSKTGNDDVEEAEEDFSEEQNLVARCVHLIRGSAEPDGEFRLLASMRKVFAKGGTRRSVYTLPPLVFAYLRLVPRLAQNESYAPTLQKLFRQLLEVLDALSPHRPLQVLRLYLDASVVADRVSAVDYAYEFLSKAYLLFEEQAVDSRSQVSVLTVFTNTLCMLRNMPEETYDGLAARVSLYGLKLLKRMDQCRCIYNASHMFARHSPSRVLECLQKSIRIADSAMLVEQVVLLVEILNKYVYHFAAGVEKVSQKFIVGLVDLIAENIKAVDSSDLSSVEGATVPPVTVAYQNTLRHLRRNYPTLLQSTTPTTLQGDQSGTSV
eukprot:ANDGO_02213.mRNA.1 Vacuolar protein sorting-associated protein 35B